MAKLRRQQKESLEESQHKIKQLEREKQTNLHEFQTLKQQHNEDRVSLTALQHHIGILPVEFTMTNFGEKRTRNVQWHSQPFYTHPQGYKMYLVVYPNGYTKDKQISLFTSLFEGEFDGANGGGKGTHVSVYASLMKGEFDDQLNWPFLSRVTVAVLNQLEDSNHITKTIDFTKATKLLYVDRVYIGVGAPGGWGHHTFIAHTDLKYNPAKNCQYLKNNSLRFRIVSVELKYFNML